MKKYYPLSSAQKRLYHLNQLNPDSVGWNRAAGILMEGDIDGKRLAESLQRVIREHECLRTSFYMLKGEPVLRVHARVKFAIQCYEAEYLEPVIQQVVRPFDLSRAPLLRVALIKKGINRHVLMVDMHDIIHDDLSLFILFSDFVSFYKGNAFSGSTFKYLDQLQSGNHRFFNDLK